MKMNCIPLQFEWKEHFTSEIETWDSHEKNIYTTLNSLPHNPDF